MKILFLSDIHGSLPALQRALAFYDNHGYDLLVLLGDLLNYGPRNGLCQGLDPQAVADVLNSRADSIVAVRGNCDAEVDQMMFQFPMLADYAVLDAGSETFFLTHGHLFNENRLPPIGIGTVLAHGHTHVPELKKIDCGLTIFNPGSISLPKGGSSQSFGFFDGTELKHYTI